MSEYLFPELKLNQPRTRDYITNDIIHRNILVFGAQASGKTEFVRCLAEKYVEKYGAGKATTILSRFFPRLIKMIGMIKSPVQLYVWEDSTLKKIKLEEIAAFFNVRNLYWSKTGINEGIIITINNVHDLFALKKQMRSSVDALFFRGLPTNKYDMKAAKDWLGEDKFNEFLDIIKRRDKEPKLKAFTYYNIRGEVGRVEWDLAKNNHVLDLDSPKDILHQFDVGPSRFTAYLFLLFSLGALIFFTWVWIKLQRFIHW